MFIHFHTRYSWLTAVYRVRGISAPVLKEIEEPRKIRGFFEVYKKEATLENQFHLLPFLPFYLGTGVVPGALRHYRGCILFALAAAGEAKLVGVFVLFHRPLPNPDKPEKARKAFCLAITLNIKFKVVIK
jgi:hypothetical protein